MTGWASRFPKGCPARTPTTWHGRSSSKKYTVISDRWAPARPPHDTAISIVKALGIAAVVISHTAILTPLETFTYYFNTAVFFFVAGYFFDDGQTAAPGRFIGRKLRRLYLPYVILGTLFVLPHNRFLKWHLIAYDFSAREAIRPYDTPELLRTLGRVFLFLHHE
nr:acyltransferase family protein [Alistipes onderdonkii]